MSEQTPANESQIPLYKKDELPPIKRLSAKGKKAHRMLKRYALIAGGVGLISSSLTHQVSTAALLTKLLNDMGQMYGLSFSDNQSKILVSAILGGAHAHWINHYLVKVIHRNTPWRSVGMLLRPAVSGSVVYYIGRLFLIHLETGVWRNKAYK